MLRSNIWEDLTLQVTWTAPANELLQIKSVMCHLHHEGWPQWISNTLSLITVHPDRLPVAHLMLSPLLCRCPPQRLSHPV